MIRSLPVPRADRGGPISRFQTESALSLRGSAMERHSMRPGSDRRVGHVAPPVATIVADQGRRETEDRMQLDTLEYEESDGVAVVTLNRPEGAQCLRRQMQHELRQVWQSLRGNEAVRAVVLTGAGERAFCTGIDRGEVPTTEAEYYFDPYTYEDPGKNIGPRSQGLWKPVIAAVNGMAAGGAFYLLGSRTSSSPWRTRRSSTPT